jgi:hypothetical protein
MNHKANPQRDIGLEEIFQKEGRNFSERGKKRFSTIFSEKKCYSFENWHRTKMNCN